jgi:hypothetical protein
LAGVEALSGAEASRATPSGTIVEACAKLSEKIFHTDGNSAQAASSTSAGVANGGGKVYVAVTDGPFPAYVLAVSIYCILKL